MMGKRKKKFRDFKGWIAVCSDEGILLTSLSRTMRDAKDFLEDEKTKVSGCTDTLVRVAVTAIKKV